MPGACLLAATAGAGAGAGKLQIATVASVALQVAVAVPEARVFALPETRTGAPKVAGVGRIIEYVNAARAVLVGPGMLDEQTTARFTRSLLQRINGEAVLVLDANALTSLAHAPEF